MLLDIIRNGFSLQNFIELLLTIPTILIALCFHESAHGWMAYKMGDSTARNLGRITMNPAKHFDFSGFLCMFVIGFGWAKPVPINSRNFRNPRKGTALTALAGPVANLILAFGGTLVLNVWNLLATPSTVATVITEFLFYFAYINIYLAVFNLIIIIPPFDGSRIVFVFLPPKLYFGIMKYERYIMIAVIILLWTGILSTPLRWITNMIFSGFLNVTFLPIELILKLVG